MDNKKVIIYIIILSSAALLLFYSFTMTGFATKNQGLIVSLDIESAQQKISPGENLLLEIVIREPGGSLEETSIIDLEYSIKDLRGNIISSKRESGAIAVKQSEITSLLIPTNTEPGVYTASVDVTYQENIYTGTKTFEVINQKRELSFFEIIIIVMIIIILFLLFWGRLQRYGEEKRRTEFWGLPKALERYVGKNIFHKNSAEQSDAKKQAKTKKQEIMDKLALLSKKETAEPLYKSDIKHQDEENEEKQQESEVELIEEAVEETEKKNRERKTVEELIEEAVEIAEKEKNQEKTAKGKKR